MLELNSRENGASISGVLHFDTANRACALGSGYLAKTSLQCVCFDLSGVKKCNIAGLAVMLQWLREAKALGITLQFSGVPEALLRMAEICGVNEWIN